MENTSYGNSAGVFAIDDNLNMTCLITGKRDNLKMHPLRNNKDQMIGWVFLHESVSMNDIQAKVEWNFNVHIKKEKAKK